MSVSLLQLSDPHLLADPKGRHCDVAARPALKRALSEGFSQCPKSPDLLLISGDLCQDESWLGYVALRDLLQQLPQPVALLPGNHDQPQLLRSCLGRSAHIAPALVPLGNWQLLLLDSHCAGQIPGRLEQSQLRWAEEVLRDSSGPVLVSVHHPIDDFAPARNWLERLAGSGRLKLVLFGHIHQHRDEQWGGIQLLGCPSTLVQFSPRQACPLGRPQDPGGRWLQLHPDGRWEDLLMRWAA